MNVLQSGVGPIPGDRYVPSSPDTVMWGHLAARGWTPICSMASGDVLTLDTMSHEGVLDEQGRDPVTWFGGFGVAREHVLEDAIDIATNAERDGSRHGPHVLTGPIEVQGAQPGDVVQIDFLQLDRRVDYGIITNRHGLGCLAGEMPLPGSDGVVPPFVSRFASVEHTTTGAVGQLAVPGGRAVARFPLAPFIGLVGVALDVDGEPNSVPPGDYGGNLDIRHLGAGTTLFLPVQLPGAGLYLGDPHFSQGDGEVALTAFEASLRATIRVTLHPGAAIGWNGPLGSDAEHWIVPGLHEDLDEAVRIATRRAIALLEPLGFDPATALAYLSAAADLHVSQVVDRVKGVHFRIRRADLGDERTLPCG